MIVLYYIIIYCITINYEFITLISGARILEDTVKLDNIEFDENAALPEFGKSKCKEDNK